MFDECVIDVGLVVYLMTTNSKLTTTIEFLPQTGHLQSLKTRLPFIASIAPIHSRHFHFYLIESLYVYCNLLNLPTNLVYYLFQIILILFSLLANNFWWRPIIYYWHVNDSLLKLNLL